MEARKLFALAAGLAVLGCFPACTVTPSTIHAQTADFNGNAANGGVYDLGPGNKGPAHVTAEWVKDYNVLAREYGKDMAPPVKAMDGVTALGDGTFTVDLEHLADKNVMASLQRSGIEP